MATNTSSPAREEILSRIRKALNTNQLSMPFPEAEHWNPAAAFIKEEISSDELFAGHFVGLGGKYSYCDNEQELLQNIAALYESREWFNLFCSDNRLLEICHNNKLNFVKPANNADETADACITRCEALVARTGSFLISSRQHLGRVSTAYYPVHIVVAYKSDLVYDISDGFELLQQRYKDNPPSMISLQTGPSRTADIEKTLVTGVHGPKEVFCFYVNV